MRIIRKKKIPIRSWLMLGFLLIFSLGLGLISSSKPTTSVRTRAVAPVGGKTITVSGTGAPAIQQAIDSAQDGDTITIPAGQYTGVTAVPLSGEGEAVSLPKNVAGTCFLRIENKKNIVFKGQGVVLFGEGHDKPDMPPYNSRMGVCVLNSSVTFEGVHIKEFQPRCMLVYDSTIVYRNGIVDGCDGGGIWLFGNSSGLFVNNKFAELNVGGIVLWQNSQAKIVNNIFFNAAVLFFYHPGANDQIQADIINNIFSQIKSDVAQTQSWQATPEELKRNKLSYNIIYRVADQTCDPKFQLWCDNFPGKILADPLYGEPVTDPRGIAAWANFGLKDGSPASGVGDPSIPGPKNLGDAGGPCADPSSSTCSTFIEQNKPALPAPSTPTAPPIPPTDIPGPTEEISTPSVQSSSVSSSPGDFSIDNQNNSQSLFIVENMGFGDINIKGLVFKDNYVPLNKNLSTGQSIQYPITSVCANSTEPFSGNVLYTDEKGLLSFTTVQIYCKKTNVFDIQ